MTKVVVISQLPPPLHGSTIMTQVLLDTLDLLSMDWSLVERRFSSSVREIGQFSLRKLISAAWMPVRTASAALRPGVKTAIFFATNRTFSFLVDCALAGVLRITCKRRIFYLHTVGFRELANRGRGWRMLVKWLLSSATDIVCLGPSLASDVSPWVTKTRVSFIGNTPAQPPLAEAKDPDSGNFFLYLSNLIPEKGVEDFVTVALEVASVNQNDTFIVAGASADREFDEALRLAVSKSSTSGAISFIGPVTDELRKWDLLRTAKALVFPSTYAFEAQPLTIIEAMAMGTPVVAYDTGGIRDIVEHMKTGLLISPGDRDSLRDAVMLLQQDPALRERLGAGARERFEESYNRSRFRANWERLLKSR